MSKIILTLLLLPVLAFAKPSTVVFNVTNNTVLYGSMDTTEVSIASISKLMTIYTVLKADQDLDEKLEKIHLQLLKACSVRRAVQK